MISGRQFSRKNVFITLVTAIVMLAAPVAFAATKGSLSSYGLLGVGTGQLVDASCQSITCDTDDVCACLTGTDGTGQGKLSFTLSIDETNSTVSAGGLRISNVGFCYPTTGNASLVSPDGKKLYLTFDLSGLVCATTGNADVFNGTYVVTGGGGKAATATGTGSLNLSQVIPSGASQLTLSGSLKP